MMAERGFLLIVDGPSAVGKSTIVRALLEQNEIPLQLARRYTTRLRRPVEDDEDIYDFIPHEDYRRLADANDFIEHKCYKFGMCYGLPKGEVLPKLEAGRHVLAMINLGNIEKVRTVVPDCFGVFISASLTTIEERLRRRQSHTDEQIEERLGNAIESLKFRHVYDLVVLNENRSVENVVHEITTAFSARMQATRDQERVSRR